MNGEVYQGPTSFTANRPPDIRRDAVCDQSDMQAPPAPTRRLPKAVVIESVDHGFFVTVGCQRFAVESVDSLLQRLNGYLKEPQQTEERWLSGNLKW